VLTGHQPRLSHARYVISVATIWCRPVLHSVGAAEAVGGSRQVMGCGDRALTATALAINGEVLRRGLKGLDNG